MAPTVLLRGPHGFQCEEQPGGKAAATLRGIRKEALTLFRWATIMAPVHARGLFPHVSVGGENLAREDFFVEAVLGTSRNRSGNFSARVYSYGRGTAPLLPHQVDQVDR